MNKAKEQRINELKVALEKAKAAAEIFSDTEDGGTCNFDSPIIVCKPRGDRTEVLTEKSAELTPDDVKKAVEAVGLYTDQWRGNYYIIFGFERGQANRRSRMAEAFEKSLQMSGYSTDMYYQMD